MRISDWSSDVCSSDLVILLSDIDGLYTANPLSDPDARFVDLVETLDERIMAMGDARSASGIGSGGMVSKLQAAKIATHAGEHLAIISGKVERPLSAFAATGRGTVFVAPPRARAKKAWLAGGQTGTGAMPLEHAAAGAPARGKTPPR